MSGFQRFEDRLDAVDVILAVLSRDSIELVLEQRSLVLLSIAEAEALARVASKEAHEGLDLLAGKLLLLAGDSLQSLSCGRIHVELENVPNGQDRHQRTIDGHSATTAATAACSRARGERNASALCVSLSHSIEEGLGLSLSAETLGWLHGESHEESAVSATRTQSPLLAKVTLDVGQTEATWKLGADQTRHKTVGVLAEGPGVANVEGCTQLIQRHFLTLFRGAAELSLEVTQNLQRSVEVIRSSAKAPAFGRNIN